MYYCDLCKMDKIKPSLDKTSTSFGKVIVLPKEYWNSKSRDKEGGIDFLGVHICKKCVNSITNTRIEDPRYEYYKNFIKNVWKKCQ